MKAVASHRSSQSLANGKPLWIQAIVAMFVLVCSTVLPQAGKPAILIPLTSSAATGSMSWVRHHRVTLLGRGALQGSLVVRGASARLGLEAIASGSLLLAAPARMCGALGGAS